MRNIYKFFCAFVIILTFFSCKKTKNYTDTYIIEIEGKYGFIDSLGREFIKPQYLYVGDFSIKEQLALVVLDTIQKTEKDSMLGFQKKETLLFIKYGYINTSGEFIFPKPSIATTKINPDQNGDDALREFSFKYSFSDGLAAVQDKSNKYFGYINIDGDTIIPCRYKDVTLFSNNIASVQKGYSDPITKQLFKTDGEHYGFIDTKGVEICDFKYTLLSRCVNERAIASIFYTEEQKDSTVISGELTKNKKGKVVIDKNSKFTMTAKETGPLCGFATYLVNDKGLIISQRLDPRFYFFNFSQDSIATVVPNNLGEFFGVGCHFLKKNGEFVKPFDGLSKAQINDIAKKGKNICGFLSENAKILGVTRFGNGLAGVKMNDNTWVFVDRYLLIRGKKESESKMEVYQNVGPFNCGIAPVKKDGKWGYIDTNFDFLIKCQYDSCEIAGKNLCKVHNSGDYITSYIDRNNHVVWQNIQYKSLLFQIDANKKSKFQWGKWNNTIPYEHKAKSSKYILYIIVTAFVIIIMIILGKIRATRKSCIKVKIDNDIKKTQSVEELDPWKYKESKKKTDIYKPKITNQTKRTVIQHSSNTYDSLVKKDARSNCKEDLSQKVEELKVKYFSPPKVNEKEDGFYMSVIYPKYGCIVFTYRTHQINRRGYLESFFEAQLRSAMKENIKVVSNANIVLADGIRPYEPDIAIICTSSKNIRIDIEIDEPYSGYSREPIHYIGCGDEYRDLKISNAGWIVVRFAEIQIKKQPKECIALVFELLHSLDSTILVPEIYKNTPILNYIRKWSKLEAKMMAVNNFREEYLNHIFGKDEVKLYTEKDIYQTSEEKYLSQKLESIYALSQDQIRNIDDSNCSFPQDSEIKFFDKEHIYIYKQIELTPVSDIISRFFKPFDDIYWSGKKAQKKGISQLRQLEEWECKGTLSREVGTFLHKQIEMFFSKQNPITNYHFVYEGYEIKKDEMIDISKEWDAFKYFMSENSIIPFRTEWRIFDPSLKIAGTIDLLCRNGKGFDIYDWKRSDKIDPTESPWNNGINGLEDIPDTRYMRYCLQQNLYRYILETNYHIAITHMFLIVLHPSYNTYRKIEVPRMDKIIQIVLSHFK